MSTALQLRTDSMDDWQALTQQAAMLLKSGFLPQAIKTPEQAIAIIVTGRELGIGAMQALQTINVIQGKPTVSPQLMLALINRSGQLEDIAVESSKEGATCTIRRKGRQSYTAYFGPAEAAAMGLNGKDNYKKQPATMYKWRAVADACRVTFADVILGLYTPDEMGAQTDAETGEVVETAPTFGQTLREQVQVIVDEQMDVVELEPPQPIRPVKPEGQQPANGGELPTLKGQAGQVVALVKALKWNDAALAGLIAEMFGVVVTPGKLGDYLEYATAEEHRELIRVLKGKLQGGQ